MFESLKAPFEFLHDNLCALLGTSKSRCFIGLIQVTFDRLPNRTPSPRFIQSHRCPRLIRHMKIQRLQEHTTKESPCVYPFTQSYRISKNSYNSHVMTVIDKKLAIYLLFFLSKNIGCLTHTHRAIVRRKGGRKEGRKEERKEARKVLTQTYH